MMKEKIEISRYDNIDDDFKSIIELHKLILEKTKLNKHLIYYDSNFPSYFINVIRNKTTDFISVLKINSVLSGFIHFKLFDNTIFLNNICLNESCQGKGFGKQFLKESLQLAFDGRPENFELDVLLSNQKALKWYTSLGLEIQNQSIWIRIVDLQKLNNENTPDTQFLKDNNGFDSIYFNEEKIATIVNKNTIIVHNLNFLDKIPSQRYTVITNQDVKKISSIRYQFMELETSARMNGRLKDVFNNLNKK